MVKDSTLSELCEAIESVATSCNNASLARRAQRLYTDVNAIFRNPNFFGDTFEGLWKGEK